MALDGMFLYQLRQELAEKALDARVDRIHQPTREEIIIALRWKGGAGKLLLSATFLRFRCSSERPFRHCVRDEAAVQTSRYSCSTRWIASRMTG